MIQKIKGTMDLLPLDTELFRKIEGVMREESARYGYGEIRTPMFERTELFVRGVGEGTDVVQKEMYTWADKDDSSISLRPEGTASVVRALIEHGKFSDTMPQKYYYIGSFFRHEAPQAGRSREFFQFGTELFGSSAPTADATAIALASSVFRRLGLEKTVRLHLNSIGCPSCRPAYREALVAYYKQHEETLCDTCRGRLAKNPLRLLDCKSPICHALAENAPKTVDYLCPECDAHFSALKGLLDEMGVDYVVDSGIVRGLDYYTRTVFEFIAEGIAAQSTVCGGGRYDGLVSSLGGPEIPAVGFGMGITRVILALQQAEIPAPTIPSPLLYIAALGQAAGQKAAVMTEALRRQGVYAECDVVGRSLKAQMKYANKTGAKYVLMLGDSELESGVAMLRNMEDSTQSEIAIADVVQRMLNA